MSSVRELRPNGLGDQPDSVVEVLREVVLFEDLRGISEALTELAGLMESRVFGPGQAILQEGESGSEMFLLTEGEASVFKKTAEGESYRVAILRGEQHAFFGEGGLLDSDARSATIRAESPCTCLVLSRERYEDFGRRHPEWAFPVSLRIARTVMARLRKTNNDLMLLYNALVSEIRGA
jgi:CRP/FNR family cyclic AMP-dependent transcriptional regulator